MVWKHPCKREHWGCAPSLKLYSYILPTKSKTHCQHLPDVSIELLGDGLVQPRTVCNWTRAPSPCPACRFCTCSMPRGRKGIQSKCNVTISGLPLCIAAAKFYRFLARSALEKAPSCTDKSACIGFSQATEYLKKKLQTQHFCWHSSPAPLGFLVDAGTVAIRDLPRMPQTRSKHTSTLPTKGARHVDTVDTIRLALWWIAGSTAPNERLMSCQPLLLKKPAVWSWLARQNVQTLSLPLQGSRRQGREKDHLQRKLWAHLNWYAHHQEISSFQRPLCL